MVQSCAQVPGIVPNHVHKHPVLVHGIEFESLAKFVIE